MTKPRAPIETMVDAVVRCTMCGALPGACDCWTQCHCGSVFLKGEKCGTCASIKALNDFADLLEGWADTVERLAPFVIGKTDADAHDNAEDALKVARELRDAALEHRRAAVR